MAIRVTKNKTALRWELGVALMLKILLLTGLWFLQHRWPERPSVKPDIAAHFALPVSSSNLENHHDR